MAQSFTRNMFFSLLAGAVGGLLGPAVGPAMASKGRPAAKEAVRAGLLMYEKACEIIGELAETASDLVAEVQAEIDAERESAEAFEPAEGDQVVPFEARPSAEPERKLYG